MTGHGLPEGVDPLGVPRADAGRDAFVLAAAVVVATLALIFTLGWVVFHQLTPASPGQTPTDDGVSGQSPSGQSPSRQSPSGSPTAQP